MSIISHVINFDLPNVPESYVHRIGRTARAGQNGMAVSFCAPDERAYMADIERLIRKRPVVMKTPENLAVETRGKSRGGGGGGSRNGAGGGGARGGRRPRRSGSGGGGRY